ncbi:hypothetical protein GGS23DRAFT_595855 [Durotheca rogersii]|uniref:uncharacterized protein n=1 Tax=Durotheca rogersii TaxID=419775 RepID=UPI0022201852|nr:uncharacterized protein GGS23DRAFT_595855 [Durotheca rogersii]KAI5864218.1 hypothetical protein GGS23DRAFT_595855 [Durotheca rogersii]
MALEMCGRDLGHARATVVASPEAATTYLRLAFAAMVARDWKPEAENTLSYLVTEKQNLFAVRQHRWYCLEAGYDELAVRCFGYLLLDEEHERAMMDQFGRLNLEFNGNAEYPGAEDMRSRFLGGDGRPPPIRGIVKKFGHVDGDWRTRGVRRILRDVIRLQQLGIINIDVAHRQLVGGKFCDFSTAITIPHFVTTPELNPCLTPKWISAMEFETPQFSINDYWEFDDMSGEWRDGSTGRTKIRSKDKGQQPQKA